MGIFGTKKELPFKEIPLPSIQANIDRAHRDLQRAKDAMGGNDKTKRPQVALYVNQVELRLHNIELSIKKQ